MKAAWIEAFGGPECIQVGAREAPIPADGDVVVRVEAATVNHHDIFLRRGEMPHVSLPIVLGSDGAGQVVETRTSPRYRAGDRVVIYPVLSCGVCRACLAAAPHKCLSFGMVGGERNGTHAEFVVVPEACLVPLPEQLDYSTAAALSLAGLTAWNMVVDEAQVEQGEHALVLGAGGGVGVFTILLLKRAGAVVHAVTSSPEKREALLALGADTVLADQPAAVLRFTRQLPERGVDVAFNSVGGNSWRYVLPAVRTAGRILTCGAVRSPAAELDMRQIFYRHLHLIGCTMGSRDSLVRVLDVAASDPRFRSPITKVIPLDALPQAHREMEDRRVTGKIVIQPAG